MVSVIAVIKIIICAVIIYATIRIHTLLEKKLHETAGNRTDLLFLSATTIIVISAIYFLYNCYVIVKPLIKAIIF